METSFRLTLVKTGKAILAGAGLLEIAKYKYRLQESGGMRRLLGLPPKKGFTRLQQNRLRLMRTHGVDVVLDVGANIGQFALEMRELGFSGRIISFEPLSDAYEELARRAAFDEHWTAVNIALGDRDHVCKIHVAGNSQSSSILDMLPIHLAALPSSAYVREETVTVRTLDSVILEYLRGDERTYLKIDTQGFERQVLAGATRSLSKSVFGIQMECGVVPLYESQARIEDVLMSMQEKGFALMSIEPEFANDRTGQLLATDLIFYRTPNDQTDKAWYQGAAGGDHVD